MNNETYRVNIEITNLPSDDLEYEEKLQEIEDALKDLCEFNIGIGTQE